MFNLHDFLMKGFLDAVVNKPDYWIILNASGWMEKGVFAEDDLAQLDKAIAEKNETAKNSI